MRERPKGTARAALTLGLLGTAAGIGVLAAAQDAPKPAVETAGQRYKNIQVLKDLPADQLIPTMRTFSASLGVRCNACHVVGPNHTGFERDDKPMKRTARKMIVMVRDLNRREKVLDGKATCYMCHRGQEMPQTQPPKIEPGAPGAPPQAGATHEDGSDKH